MKPTKIIIAILMLLSFKVMKAQELLPVKLDSKPDSIDIAWYGTFSFEGNTGIKNSRSSSGMSGFVIHTKPRKFGLDLKFTQIRLDFNSIIIGWDPFNWNTLIKHSVDSFNLQRMPYSQDCFLHIGVKRNYVKSQFMTQGRQKYMHSLYSSVLWRPYYIAIDNINYKFQTINWCSGYVWSYLQNDIPVIDIFKLATAFQLNLMVINESENNINNFKAIAGAAFNGYNYLGTGFKLSAQTKYLNTYIELRQYWSLDKTYFGNRFTKNPSLLVGAFINANFFVKKKRIEKDRERTFQ